MPNDKVFVANVKDLVEFQSQKRQISKLKCM